MPGQDDVGMRIVACLETSIQQLERTARLTADSAPRHYDSIFTEQKGRMVCGVLAALETAGQQSLISDKEVRQLVVRSVKSFSQRFLADLALPCVITTFNKFIAALLPTTGGGDDPQDSNKTLGSHASPASSLSLSLSAASQATLLRYCAESQARSQVEAELTSYVSAHGVYSVEIARHSQAIHRLGEMELRVKQLETDVQAFEWLHDPALRAVPVFADQPAVTLTESRTRILERVGKAALELDAAEQAVARCEQQYQALETQVSRAIQFFRHQKDPNGILRLLQDAINLRRQAMQLASDRSRQLNELAKGIAAFESMRTLQTHQHPIASSASRFILAITELHQLRAEASRCSSTIEDLNRKRDALHADMDQLLQDHPQMLAEERTASSELQNSVQRMLATSGAIIETAELDDSLWPDLEPLLASIVKLTADWEALQQIHGLAKRLHAAQRKYRSSYAPIASTARSLTTTYPSGSMSPPDVAHIANWIAESSSSSSSTAMLLRLEESGSVPSTDGILDLQDKVQSLLSELAQHATDRVQGDDMEDQESSDDEDDEAMSVAATMEDQRPQDNKTRPTSAAAAAVAAVTAQPQPASSTARNTTAMSVLRRVREKLEGTDGQASTAKMTVAAQVEWVIREATAPDNLCKLYEGWTAWI